MFVFLKNLYTVSSKHLELGFNVSPLLFRPLALFLLFQTHLFLSSMITPIFPIYYVNDIILTASSTSFLQHIISLFRAEFSMTDLGVLHHFLGIAILRDDSGLFLSQRQYILDLLSRAGMLDCQPSRTPVDTSSKLSAW
jgi:hypothetical protein